jgi:feruloyl-CoA synthase
MADLPLGNYRPTHVGPRDVTITRERDGVIRLVSPHQLRPYPERFTETLVRWAIARPDRVFLGERAVAGGWRELTYAQVYAQVRAISAALLMRNLSPDRPIVILSENDIEHALIGLAAMHVGIPYAPISTAYSTISRDFEKLRHIINLLTPGLVFASSAERYQRAIQATVPADTEVVINQGFIAGRATTAFSSLLVAGEHAAVDLAHAAVGPDTIAKFLFTSGSTANPKGVINTHRMLCCNQQMYVQTFPLFADDPLVQLDWQPWNHTAGGNATFGCSLYNGGSYYIDAGKPTPALIGETIRNLRDIAPTVYVSVPKIFEVLVEVFKTEPKLAEKFFSRLRMIFYAGAGLSQHLWEELARASVRACGERVPVMSGLGSTETAPVATSANWFTTHPANIGLPAPGCELKLVPNAEKMEIRFRGPNITPGYWRQPALSAAAFDEEGFYRMGDAARFVDPARPEDGLLFDGRVAEDFKLDTATWVSVGPLRAKVLQEGAPYVLDVVITGHDQREVGMMIFPNIEACRGLAQELKPQASVPDLLAHPTLSGWFQSLLDRLFTSGTGSSNRIARAMLLEVPPSFEASELTDKGAISQRAVLRARAERVTELYAATPSARVMRAATAR